MNDLEEPVKCRTCIACCRDFSDIVLQPPDVLSTYDYIPADAALVSRLLLTSPTALMPLEELAKVPTTEVGCLYSITSSA